MKIALLLLAISIAGAQTSGSIQATGTANLNVPPDMATLNVGVITQAATADAAAMQNAQDADAMIKALQSVLASNGTIETVYYSLDPRYNNAVNQPPILVGYTANNTVQVKTNNIAIVGKLIDAATAAHANSVSGPSFGLQDSEPTRQKALTAAGKQALAHAAAIAAGLGAKTGAVVSAQEGSAVTPIFAASAAGGAATSTPIQNGTVMVSATVTVTVALVQ
jgi:hypothetical protein